MQRRDFLTDAASSLATLPALLARDPVRRPAAGTARSVFDVRTFGATGDGRTDDAPAINRAAAAAAAAGGGVVYCPAGTYAIGSSIRLESRTLLGGDGIGRTVVRRLADGYVAVAAIGDVTSPLAYVELRDFTVHGRLDALPTEGGEEDRNILVSFARDVAIERVESLYSRKMGIATFACERVLVRGCTVRHSARDAINCTGARQARIVENVVAFAGDDAIAAHFSAVTDALGAGAFGVIANNVVEGAMAIKCLSANSFVIANNVSRRCRGAGIVIDGGGAFANEGPVDAALDIIAHNVIEDLCDGPGGAAPRAIVLELDARDEVGHPVAATGPMSGGRLPVSPLARGLPAGSRVVFRRHGALVGTVELTESAPPDARAIAARLVTGAVAAGDQGWLLPEHQASRPAARGGGWGVLVSGNIIAQKHAAGTSIPNGMLGTESLPLPDRIGEGVFVQGVVHGLSVHGNQFDRVRRALYTYRHAHVPGLLFHDNVVRRCNAGVVLTAPAGETRNAAASIGDNLFDLDPYHESPRRAADGGWTSGTDATVLWLDGVSGVSLAGNSLRNAARVTHLAGTAAAAVGANMWFTSTLGEADPRGEDVQEIADPRHPRFGQVLHTKSRHLAGPPTAGFWRRGEIITSAAPRPGEPSGWVCVSSGGAHSVTWAPSTMVPASAYALIGGTVFVATTAGRTGLVPPAPATTMRDGDVLWLRVGAPAEFAASGRVG